jgi:hypothetical protein
MIVIKMLLELAFQNKKQLFCAFVDFEKAFDKLWRTGLWEKIIRHGITGKMFNVIFNMYDSINSAVSYKGQQSPQFASHIGVRQGENLSPLLFALYLNDIEEYMLQNNCTYLHIDDDAYVCERLKVMLLLYADDSVVIADSETSLQHSLNILQKYCELWKLKVNVKKLKL